MKYPPVKKPKRVDERWLDLVFAPLRDYLEREHPDHAGRIMVWMEYMGTGEEACWTYRNTRTRDRIVFDRDGKVVDCGEEALRFTFDDPPVNRVLRPPREERFIHPAVREWMEVHLTRGQREAFGEEVEDFLQEYWGPRVEYEFGALKTGYPLPGRLVPHCLYLCPSDRWKIVFQFVGDPIVERRCRYAEYEAYRHAERHLMRDGWQVVTVIREVLDENPHLFAFHLARIEQFAAERFRGLRV